MPTIRDFLMLAAALASVGYSTRVANDAVAALQSVRDGVPDIALLDIGLPVMNGYELARRLKSAPGCENISLVAVTGYGQTSDRMLSADAGFDAHLVKPIDLEHLAQVVAGLRRSSEEPSAP